MEQLTEKIKFVQSEDGYRFSSDAINLFKFFECKRIDSVIDIGCGSGVLSFLIYDKFSPKRMVGVEIQKQVYDQFVKNIKLNNADIEAINADVKTLKGETFDVAICNPPYFELTDANINESEEIAISRHEIKINIEEIILASSKLLRFGGRLWICYPAKKLQTLVNNLTKFNFAIKKLKFLFPEGKKREAYLALVCAQLGGKQGCVVESNLK